MPSLFREEDFFYIKTFFMDLFLALAHYTSHILVYYIIGGYDNDSYMRKTKEIKQWCVKFTLFINRRCRVLKEFLEQTAVESFWKIYGMRCCCSFKLKYFYLSCILLLWWLLCVASYFNPRCEKGNVLIKVMSGGDL